MPRHLKISTVAKPALLILAGFALILIIMISIITISLTTTASITEELHELVERNNAKISAISRMSEVIRKRVLNIYTIVNLEDPFELEAEWERLSRNAGLFLEARDELYALGLSQQQFAQLERQKEYLAAAYMLMDKVVDYSRSGNRRAARRYLPAAREANAKVLKELTAMRAYQHRLAHQAAERAETDYQASRHQLLFLLGLGVAVCLGIIVFILHRITSQQAALTDALEALRESNESLEQRVEDRTRQLMVMQQENLRMGAELNVTRQLQKMLLPQESELRKIGPLDIAGFMEPAEEVGGDYYDVLQGEDYIRVGIGDVTGHGLESGVLMLMVHTTVRALHESGITVPREFIQILNNAIYQNLQRMGSDKNLTLALLDYSDGCVCLCGQHEEVLVIRAGGEVERIDTSDLGFIIGLEQNISDFVHQQDLCLAPGDGMVLYTDGITEAFNLAGEQYGLDRLCEVTRRHWHYSAKDIQAYVLADFYQHIKGRKACDDITLLIIKRKNL